ncbi:MAG: hypothetical protein JRJ19_04370 [Deltaproteobacteria bacterium]|nr:hypothetical protein [Deltaproteobacteria bacterium]MBW1871275.1 hypothetical protein [Deltaproteobacteria bacterium]
MKALMGILLAAAIFLGGYTLINQPNRVPDLILIDSGGQPTNLEDMRTGRENQMLVFMMRKCPISKYSVTIVTQLVARYRHKIAFTGLYFGSRADARKYRDAHKIPFPVYGIKGAPDPLAINELYEEIGDNKGTRKVIYGGTIVFIDQDRYVLFKLSKDEIRELPERLADLGF